MRSIQGLRLAFLSSCAGCALSLSSAVASDMTAAPAPTWQGLYVGAHGGYAWSNTDWSLSGGQFFNPGASKGSASFDGEGGFGGIHAGYNFQSGNFVYGLEGGYTWFDNDETVGSNLFAGDQFSNSVNDVGTISVRAGTLIGATLLYGKLGYATGEVETRSVSADGASIASTSERHDGWTIGAGIEHQLTSKLIVGVSYDYIDLGSQDHSATLTVPPAGLFDADAETEIHAIGLRASFKFN